MRLSTPVATMRHHRNTWPPPQGCEPHPPAGAAVDAADLVAVREHLRVQLPVRRERHHQLRRACTVASMGSEVRFGGVSSEADEDDIALQSSGWLHETATSYAALARHAYTYL